MAVILMVSVLLIILIVPFVVKNFINKFEHNGIEFQKTKLGEIIFYSTRIPLSNIQGQAIGTYSINFREDPRELEFIEVIIPDNVIDFAKGKTVYISLEADVPICEDNLIAVAGLTDFLKSFGALSVKGAMSNASYANETGFPYVTCKNHPENTVILIKNGEETIIKKTGDNCYELMYKDCEINKVTEKFGLIILKKYMKYFEKMG